MLAESLLEENLASCHWFAFINRRGDRLKLLGWDGRGFWIWSMYLEAGTFQSPARDGGGAWCFPARCLARKWFIA